MDGPVKVNFNLEPDPDGYPPATVESLWANPVGGNFEIDSIPFFTRDATVGDLVRAFTDSTGALWFDGVEYRSRRSLIRVVFFEPDCKPSVVARLKEMGCGTEGMDAFKLLAVDVPADMDLSNIQDFLRSEAAAGHLDYEEAILRHED